MSAAGRRVRRGMEIVVIALTEWTDWRRGEDGEVMVMDEHAFSCSVVGCARDLAEAAALVAAFCRARPPADDGSAEGHDEVLPISHFTLSSVALGAPLSFGRAWWARVPESDLEGDVLKAVAAGRTSLVPAGEPL